MRYVAYGLVAVLVISLLAFCIADEPHNTIELEAGERSIALSVEQAATQLKLFIKELPQNFHFETDFIWQRYISPDKVENRNIFGHKSVFIHKAKYAYRDLYGTYKVNQWRVENTMNSGEPVFYHGIIGVHIVYSSEYEIDKIRLYKSEKPVFGGKPNIFKVKVETGYNQLLTHDVKQTLMKLLKNVADRVQLIKEIRQQRQVIGKTLLAELTAEQLQFYPGKNICSIHISNTYIKELDEKNIFKRYDSCFRLKKKGKHPKYGSYQIYIFSSHKLTSERRWSNEIGDYVRPGTKDQWMVIPDKILLLFDQEFKPFDRLADSNKLITTLMGVFKYNIEVYGSTGYSIHDGTGIDDYKQSTHLTKLLEQVLHSYNPSDKKDRYAMQNK